MSSRRPRFFNLWTEPDLHLLKQVEQVAVLVFARTGQAFCQDSEHGDHRGRRGPRIYNGNCGFGYYFAAETARSGPVGPCAKGGPAILPPPGSKGTGPLGFRVSCSPDQVDSYINSVLLPKPDLFDIGAP